MAFKELDKRPVNEVEKSILEKWKKEDILKLTTDKRKGESRYDHLFANVRMRSETEPGSESIIEGLDWLFFPISREVEQKLAIT